MRRNKLYKASVALFLGICLGVGGQNIFTNSANAKINIYSNPAMVERDSIKKIVINWKPISGAVSYDLIILKNKTDVPVEAVATWKKVFSTGYDVDVSRMKNVLDYYWAVRAADYDGKPMGEYSEPLPISEQIINPTGPITTSEYDEMKYSLTYPVYSWIPVRGAHSYSVQVSRETKPGLEQYNVIRTFTTDNNVLFDDSGYTWPSKYSWQVRAFDVNNNPITEWSKPCYFEVESRAKVAALGDSITHGGGATMVPPSYRLYNWETYCTVPVKNIGLSGDTVQGMNERFDREVLPLKPQILLIMGGVNNFRAGCDAWDTIEYLERIKQKCLAHNIIPVFLTATPINEEYISKVPSIGYPADNWKYEQQVENLWIKQQTYWVDITPKLTDKNGRLRKDMTTDGLHPDYEAKKIIGEMVSEYLLTTFPDLNLAEK